jgi:formate dehydrogenase iron-sulfur subunit
VRLYISDDAAALACGADRMAARAEALGAEVVRTSSWGLHWLEPLVEIETGDGRIGYGPVAAAEMDALLAGALEHKRIGDVAAHPFVARQTRLTFARAGRTRPLSLDDYAATGGWA